MYHSFPSQYALLRMPLQYKVFIVIGKHIVCIDTDGLKKYVLSPDHEYKINIKVRFVDLGHFYKLFFSIIESPIGVEIEKSSNNFIGKHETS